MPKYYFNIRISHHLIQDIEGAELPSARYAREEALQAARVILSKRASKGEPLDGDVFESTTEDGQLIDTVPFKQAIVSD